MEKKLNVKEIAPEMLLHLHARMQKGTYFSKNSSLDLKGMCFAHSKLIEDYYWNYAYNADLSDLSETIDIIKEYAASINRKPILYVLKGDESILKKHKGDEIEEELWMISNLETNLAPDDAVLDIEIVSNRPPNEDFLTVFRNAYGEEEIGSVGYSELPKEYVESLKKSSTTDDVEVFHLIGKEASEAVVVATIFIANGIAGLYNVGTIHSKRRKNYGSIISNKAILLAKEKRCNAMFLQTKAGSEVERLYAKIGFEPSFTGVFFELQ